MFTYVESRGPVDVAFTDRAGGVSTGTFSSLNLAADGPDDPACVRENLRRVTEAFAGNETAPAALMRQVHGARVVTLDPPAAAALAQPEPPECDGLVTDAPGLTLVVRVADCVPLLVADPGRGVVAALHAGRPGLVAGIVPAGVAALRARGARDLVAWIGPHVCGRCYEVPAEMRDAVAAVVPEAWAETSWGTPSVDVGAGVRAQLAAASVAVVDASRCTREHEDLYSFRRDGAGAGRMAGLIRVRA